MSGLFLSSMVYAFEPHPAAFAKLKNATIDFYLHKQSEEDPVKWSVGFSALKYKSNINTTEPVKVEVIDLVEFIKDLHQPIALLKIDIEGAEFEVLEKMIASGVVHQIKTILVEAHEQRIPELQPAAQKVRAKIKQQNIQNINLDWR